ncbi:formin-binding protein 4-like isoform X1 [Bombus flavifrons]|uniref:formin-binding protein 4-like isoform X1 n=1 Tax=Bombus flavifrons TaxID=103934 RepID=UPI003704CD10
MKRRQRRPVLELNQSQSGFHGEHLQKVHGIREFYIYTVAFYKHKHINSDYSGQNIPTNPLANLLCHYNSDSDTEDSKKDCKLDDQVNNFFKEIQLIAPKQPVSNESSNVALTTNSNTRLAHYTNQQALMWRECLDESSGYPYYWHIETNEVTWEMPDELRYLKNNIKTSSVIKPLSMQESHWVDFSSVTYQQSHENIPEGMIPREVVARNRNRYICNETLQKPESQTDPDTANTSDTMDNDSDDGKIEMITSYGSDESDSDTVDENRSKNDMKESSVKSTSTTPKLRCPEKLSTSTPIIQPQLDTNQMYKNKGTVEESMVESVDSKPSNDAEAKYLINQIKQDAVQKIDYTDKINNDSRLMKESVTKKSSNKHSVDSDVDFRISLVPGYDEDSDVEEESEDKQERKALFPIPQTKETMDSMLLGKIDGDQIAESNDNEEINSERKNVQEDNEDILERLECRDDSNTKTEEDTQKGNKFVDNVHGRNKFFQRKKRIAFDVPSTKIKTNNDNETSKLEVETQREEMNSCDEHLIEPQVDQQEEPNTANENVEENVSTCKDESNSTEGETSTSETNGESKEDEGEVNLLSQIILEKLKFLSEGKPGVSPVQLMSIQLQTLFVAWEAGCLEKNYLRRWLSDTSHELERLEQDAAPPGWLCQWDRSHKRYYYQNTATGITQWTYPDTGIAGGAEEMEICSTPPPAEQEDIIIPVEEEGLRSKSKKSEGGETTEDMTMPRNSDIEAPPPPQISNPSPPPPPRIYAEDLKRDKRKQDKCNEKLDDKRPRLGEEGAAVAEIKQLENSVAPSSALLSPQPANLANVTSAEPLPPGVDLTEAPYEIPATALKRIIYGAVQSQGAALYDAAARDPTVPILSHPATIVQEHYLQYPAYHQHLHAPAALVLPHKHNVQPAIQLIPDYTPIYTNHKVIEKPPVKTAKESLVSALDSFYNDIARIENIGIEKVPQRQDTTTVEPSSLPTEEAKLETEQESIPVETTVKEKKRKRTRIGISKKHKEVSSMVAKWQKVQQNFENT